MIKENFIKLYENSFREIGIYLAIPIMVNPFIILMAR